MAYRGRASFFNATARTADGYIGLIFRRPPFVKVPDASAGVGKALAQFVNDADMLGTSLYGYTKNVVYEVIAVGRAGTLMDWEGDFENRVYGSLYTAEQIINWRVERVNGRNVPTLIVLSETATVDRSGAKGDEFEPQTVEQVRVLRLVPSDSAAVGSGKREYQCQVEVWQPKEQQAKTGKTEWQLVATRIPLRLGKPLPLIPFVFHGPRHSLPGVDRLPLEDIITVNVDHYRLDADYKHGLHFTALPTAWVSGFSNGGTLRIGSSTAWVSEAQGATARPRRSPTGEVGEPGDPRSAQAQVGCHEQTCSRTLERRTRFRDGAGNRQGAGFRLLRPFLPLRPAPRRRTGVRGASRQNAGRRRTTHRHHRPRSVRRLGADLGHPGAEGT